MASIQLMAVIFIVTSIAGPPESAAFADEPCKEECCAPLRYNQFVHKHVLKETFDRNSLDAWKSYLMKKNLWCKKRRLTQSFLEKSQNVENICTSGKRVQNGGNLCISTSKMEVYDVITTMDNNGVCTITLNKKQTFVVVACDKVGNRCLPVHFEKYKGQSPSNLPC